MTKRTLSPSIHRLSSSPKPASVYGRHYYERTRRVYTQVSTVFLRPHKYAHHHIIPIALVSATTDLHHRRRSSYFHQRRRLSTDIQTTAWYRLCEIKHRSVPLSSGERWSSLTWCVIDVVPTIISRRLTADNCEKSDSVMVTDNTTQAINQHYRRGMATMPFTYLNIICPRRQQLSHYQYLHWSHHHCNQNCFWSFILRTGMCTSTMMHQGLFANDPIWPSRHRCRIITVPYSVYIRGRNYREQRSPSAPLTRSPALFIPSVRNRFNIKTYARAYRNSHCNNSNAVFSHVLSH